MSPLALRLDGHVAARNSAWPLCRGRQWSPGVQLWPHYGVLEEVRPHI